MPVPSTIADLSATASSNYPQGSESPSTLDDYIRAQGAIVRQVYENGIAGNAATATTATTATTANAGPSSSQFSHRNKIINGDMNIAQRGTSFPAIGAGVFAIDRWRTNSYTTSAVLTVSQQSDVPSGNEFQNSLRLTVTTADSSIAAGDNFSIVQVIEGYNVRDLIGRDFTLSFRVRSSKTGTHCVAFRNSGIDRSYIAEYTVNVANTWESKSITVPGGLITAGTWDWTNGTGIALFFCLAAGSTFQTTAGAWQTGNYMATANQVNCLDTVGNIFAITGVQLEPGSIATPFEHRPYGTELALCQRYYEIGATFWEGYAQAAGNVSQTVKFMVTKRIAPTLTATDKASTNRASGPSVTSVSINEGRVYQNCTATTQTYFATDWTASAEL